MAKGEITLPPFYVICVNYYNSGYIKQLITSLQTVAFIDKFIVVNHSPEDSLEALQAPFPIQVINQENAGYGAGLNRGLVEIPSENAVALFCNPDVALITPEAVADALTYMVVNPRVGCLIPLSVDQDGKSLHPCRTFYSLKSLLASRIQFFKRILPKFYREHFYMDTKGMDPVEVDWGCGAAMLYRVSSFGRRPAFDERFFLYMEDVDLCARLWGAGLSVVYYPQLVFRHYVQRHSHTNWRFLGYHLASLIRFVWKYRGLPQKATLLKY
jgi:GT2 family glycosyltransferase